MAWLTTSYLNAWWWSAMLHSVQYLVIVVDRHLAETRGTPAAVAQAGPFARAGAFYVLAVATGFFLFVVAPMAYTGLRFAAAESIWMMGVVVNLHHFIVDGFIWRTPAPRPATARAA